MFKLFGRGSMLIAFLKEQYPGFTMILRGSKTQLGLTEPSKNGFILENITQQMITTH